MPLGRRRSNCLRQQTADAVQAASEDHTTADGLKLPEATASIADDLPHAVGVGIGIELELPEGVALAHLAYGDRLARHHAGVGRADDVGAVVPVIAVALVLAHCDQEIRGGACASR